MRGELRAAAQAAIRMKIVVGMPGTIAPITPSTTQRPANAISSQRARRGRGLRGGTPVAAAELRLRPGDSLLLYTDGLTDAGAPDRVLGPEDLAWILADARGRSAAGIAEHVRAVAVPDAPTRQDDIAMLVIQANRRSAS